MSRLQRLSDYVIAAGFAAIALAVSPLGIEWLTARPVLTPRITTLSSVVVLFLLVLTAAALLHGRARRMAFVAAAWVFPLIILAGLEIVAIAVHLADRVAPVEDNSTLKNWSRWPGYLLSDGRWADSLPTVRLYRPWRGDGIVINELGLRTTPPTPKAPGEWRIAITGGSAVWGFRVLDADTIPALVQDALRRGNPHVTVYNFGIEGATNASELALLKHFRAVYQLDQVVFYTAGNDVIGPYLPDMDNTKELGWIISDKTGFELLKSARREFALWTEPSVAELAHFDNDVLAPTLRNNPLRSSIAAADGYCKKEKLRCDFILQPLVVTRKNPPSAEARLVHNTERLYPQIGLLARRMYADVMASDSPASIHDFSGVLDGDPRTFFIDMIHLNEAGNRHIADAIAKTVRVSEPPPGLR